MSQPTQKQIFYAAQKVIGSADRLFMDMVKSETAPLTNRELKTLVERYPQRWKKYEHWIGRLAS